MTRREAHRGRLLRKYLLLIMPLVTAALLVSGGIGPYFSTKGYELALASLQREKAIGAASRFERYVRQIAQQLAFAALAQLDAGGRERLAVSRHGMDVVASGRDRSAQRAFVNARCGEPWFSPSGSAT